MIHKTIYDGLFKEKNLIIDSFVMIFSVFFLAILSNIRIPIWPVPITMQTLGIFAIAFTFGYRRGALSILLYILTGIFGVAVFSGYKSGISAIMGPTGGYIIGFLAMVLVVGYMVEKGMGRNIKSVILVLFIGQSVLYLFGLMGLWMYLNVGILEILKLGLFPFLIGDVIKAILAVSIFPATFRSLNNH